MATTILTQGQRRLMLGLCILSGFMVGNAAFLWLAPEGLSGFYMWMLVLHVVVGTLLLLPMVWFVAWHLPRALAMRNRRAVWSGVLVTVSAFALLVTGLYIAPANSAARHWAFLSHQLLALAAPLGYAIHRFVGRHRPERVAVAWGLCGPAVLLAGSLAVHHATLPPPRPEPQHFVPPPPPGVDPFRTEWAPEGPGGAPPDSPFAPASTRSATGGFLPDVMLSNADLPDARTLADDLERHGFAVDARIGSRSCATCHADIVEQWARSAHRFASFNNPFYRASVERFREDEDGRRRSQWCAGCHDPAIMMAGDWMDDIDPESPLSQAGLTCMACHAMDAVHGLGGNGNYRIADDRTDPYLFPGAKDGLLKEVHDLLIRSKPDEHKRRLMKPVFSTPEYCATCHKVSLDVPVNRYHWLRGQDEYDNHQDSGVSRNNARTFYLPPTATNCRDCHMPLVDTPLGDVAADENGKVRSHLFPAVNTALPHVRGDTETLREVEEFMQDRVTVDVFAVRPGAGEAVTAPDLRDVPLPAGESVELHVVVRNERVGHTFPGGTTDSNQAWIHLQVFADGSEDDVLYESGALDPDSRRVDPDAHFYRSVFVNERGEEMRFRNAQDFRAPVYVNVIGPGTADIVRYRFTVPPDVAGGRLVVRARLRWRKFRRDYTEFAWETALPGRPVPNLPVTDMATDTVSFPVGVAATSAPLAAESVAEHWTRWNDWGIGLLLQGDTKGAERAFGTLRDAVPDRVDGWRNLARTKLRDGSVEEALALLREAEKRNPGDPQTAYFFGVALARTARLDDAVAAFERAREDFPRDRTIHRELGRIRFKLDRFEESLQDFLRVLAIDPEDRIAHYNRARIYDILGDDEAARLAWQAAKKYAIDESAQEWTNAFRRRRPDVNRESQAVHVHDLRPVAR